MGEDLRLALPSAVFLEEVNFPADLAQSLAQRTVGVEVLPEEAPATRRVEPDDTPLLIDPDGNRWNDYRPLRITFRDPQGRAWRLPRRWLIPPEAREQPPAESTHCEASFTEVMNLPSDWDIWEINIPWDEIWRTAGHPAEVLVQITPEQLPKVWWRDSRGVEWRLPHDWRRRRIILPGFEVLVSQGIISEVAEKFAGKRVSVNYHPGSFCCLPDQYRFRDEDGIKWPVKIADCVLLGYGSEREYRG